MLGEIANAFKQRALSKLKGTPMPGSLDEQISRLRLRQLQEETKPTEAREFNFEEELNRGNRVAESALEQKARQEQLRLQTMGAPNELTARGTMLSQEDRSAIDRMNARAGLIRGLQGDVQAQELALAESDFDKMKYITDYAKEQNAENRALQNKAATMGMIGRGLAGAAALASLFA